MHGVDFSRMHRIREQALVKHMIAWKITFVWRVSYLMELADRAIYAVCIINSIVMLSEHFDGFICICRMANKITILQCYVLQATRSCESLESSLALFPPECREKLPQAKPLYVDYTVYPYTTYM